MNTGRCPHCGQPYGPGRIVVSWTRCDCAGRDEAGGHDVYACANVECLKVIERAGCVGAPPAADRMPPLH